MLHGGIFAVSIRLALSLEIVSFIVKIHLVHKAVYKIAVIKGKPVHVQYIQSEIESKENKQKMLVIAQ